MRTAPASAHRSKARFACRRIGDRMVELLALYKLDAGQRAFAMEAHSPHDLLEDVRREASTLALGRLQVDITRAGNLPAFWFFDRQLVEGAMMNAVHNALLHARSRIVLRAGVREQMLAFSVEDDGPGYPPERLGADWSAPQPSSSGTGLGLHFAQAVAKAHEHQGRTGRLELANLATGGAAFTLLLP